MDKVDKMARCLSVCVALVLSWSIMGGAAAQETATKPRLLVLTDIGGDPDDQQSLVRLLTYANSFDFEGLIATSSNDNVPHPNLIHEMLDAYAQVLPNLQRHAPDFPNAATLRALVKTGSAARGRDAFGAGKDTEASRWIRSVIEKADPRPLDICIWGGQTDLAQALWTLRRNSAGDRLDALLSNLRVYDIGDQDGIADWIMGTFPDLFYVLGQAPEGQDKREAVYRGMYLGGDESLTARDWINTHLRNGHGPLGALYPDRTWTAPNPHAALKEGDTPSWFYFLRNGLMFPDNPEWGGWGGRFKPISGRQFRDAVDTVGDTTHARATVWRWRAAYQADFQARMDWCVASDFARANHNPKAVLNGDATLDAVWMDAKPGERLRLSADGSSDPDGDTLAFRWFAYPEAGSLSLPLTLKGADTPEVVVTVPRVEEAAIAHIILEVRDDGEPNLYAFRRAVIEITPKLKEKR